MIQRLHRIRRAIGMDRAVFYIAATRGWSLTSGLLTLWFIGTFLSEPVQGFYYTFGSILALQTFLELGISQSLIQTASHEFAHLSFGSDGRLAGDAAALQRLLEVGKLSLRWYRTIALLLVIFVAPIGHWFFASQHNQTIAWEIPWWSLCLLTALSIQLAPVLFLLEGCGQIASVNAARFWIGISTTLVSWAALSLGAGLYTGVIQVAVYALGLLLYLGRRWFPVIRQIIASKALAAKAFIANIWSFQWRIGVSWVCGYFSSEIIKPILFKLHGPEAAGQVGMTMQAVGGIVALASAWTSSKAPTFGTLIAKRRFDQLDKLFRTALLQSLGVATLGAVTMFGFVVFVKAHFRLGERFLPLLGVAFFCLSAIAVQITAGTAVYLRAHKEEPFMGVSILNAILVVAGVSVLGWWFAGTGAALGYFAATGLIAPPLALAIFNRKRAEWHVLP